MNNYKKISDLLYEKNFRAKPLYIYVILVFLNKIPRKLIPFFGSLFKFLKLRCRFTILNKNLYFYIHSNLKDFRYHGGMSHEPRISENLLRLAPENSVFFDIGCSFGWYSILLSDKSKETIAFDANDNSSLLNVHLNKIKNFKFYPCFLSDYSDGKSTFTIDDLIRKNISLPNIIKIDVEGEELKVLSGAKNLFSESPPYMVLVETHSEQLFYQCSNFLKYFGYRVYHLGCPKINIGGDIYEASYDLKTNTFVTQSETRMILGLKK